MIYSMNDTADNIAIEHTDDTVYIDEAYVIGSSHGLHYANDAPCVNCEHKTDCSTTAQACQGYRKYLSSGKFVSTDIGIKFKGLK